MVPTIAPPLAVALRDECAIPKSMISAWPSFADDDVFRLEVAVDDADVVRRRHAVGNLARQRQGMGGIQRPDPLDEGGQRLALDEAHRDVFEAADLAKVVDADDVLVSDLPREEELALEATRPGRAGCARREPDRGGWS